MDVLSLINKDIAALQLTDNIGKAVAVTAQSCLPVYPVVSGDRWMGFLPSSISGSYPETVLLSEIVERLLKAPVVPPHFHGYDILRMLHSPEYVCVAVVDTNMHYYGIIEPYSVLRGLSNSLAIASPGTVLVLRIRSINFELSRIARIIEEKMAKILFLHVDGEENSGFLTVHMKINTQEIQAISSDLERFGYEIVDHFQEKSKYNDELMDNYQALMKYLDY